MIRKGQVLEKVRVESMAAEGKCIARVENQVIFIPQVAPGDLLDIRVTGKKKKFLQGTALTFHEHSPMRTPPICSHFGLCGGCKWMHISYEHQLEYKRQQVVDQLERIGKINIPQVPLTLASPNTENYRNKLEFTFSNRKWLTTQEMDSGIELERNGLGFHLAQKFDKILDINRCYLQKKPSNEIRLALKQFALNHGLSFYDLRENRGLLRNLIIRTTTTGELMVIVQFGEPDHPAIGQVMAHLQQKFSQITSLMYVINQKGNDTFNDLEVENYAGKSYITEVLPTVKNRQYLEFRIGPKSFFQTNSEQAIALYHHAQEFADLKNDQLVYDLYSGIGTIANLVAPYVDRVIGMEQITEAVEDAKVNSNINQLHNTEFLSGDIKDLLHQAIASDQPKPDVIITDPPRAGMHPQVIQHLLSLEADKIVYISCNPATQARDLALMDEKYTVKAVQPVDMFPHTHHVENIVLLSLKSKV